jgi:hypothetical protein
MKIARRLFIVPLANNDHGKTTLLNALLAQGLGARSPERKGVRELVSPAGRHIDAYVFVRSYQETEKKEYKSVKKALNGNDRHWTDRELIVFPSHVHGSGADVDEMIAAAHEAGFDIVCASVLLDDDDRRSASSIWSKEWDERWSIPNPHQENEEDRRAQLAALGCDLWVRICRALSQ